MAVFQCKMCGGQLDITEGQSIATCPYCNTKQTIPKLDNEKIAKILERANALRLAGEYDKAISEYDKILETNDVVDAEIYWNIVLCKYGVIYVDDPATGGKVPTINRTQVTPVLIDEDYKKVLELADPTTRQMYEKEAEVIDNIQENILAISRNEEPFDVFICYKETDENGNRTQDSVDAFQIYHYLTDEGYKVFLSRVTLADKFGKFEPYIYAALNSARVMLVIGSKKEYFEAPWVKNEWMRYLNIMKKDPKKTLRACYKNMTPYELPPELSYYQGGDMTQLGFIQDISNGIKKYFPEKNERAREAAQSVVQTQPSGGQVTPIIKKAKLFIEQRDYDSAKKNIDVAFDIDPENWEIYLCKLLMDYQLGNESELKNLNNTFDGNYNYKKIIQFADEQSANRIKGYNDYIIERLANENAEQLYRNAEGLSQFKTDNDRLNEARNYYLKISKYKDSSDKANKCVELIYANILRDLDSSKDINKLEKARNDIAYIRDKFEAEKVEKLSSNLSKKITYAKALNVKESAFASIPAIDEQLRALDNIRDFEGVSNLIYELQTKKIQIDRNVKKAKRITFLTAFAAVFGVLVFLMVTAVIATHVSNGLKQITANVGPNAGRKVYIYKINGKNQESGRIGNKYDIFNGILARDAWFTSGNMYFYYDENGEKVTNTIKRIDGKDYAFKEDGSAVQNDFFQDKYFDENRELVVNKFQEIDGKTYWINIEGKKDRNPNNECNSEYALTGRQIIDDKEYLFSNNGEKYKNFWNEDSTGTKYYDENGVMAKDGEKTINGKRYFFDATGRLLKNTIVNNTYYAKEDGSFATSEIVSISGKAFYYKADGTRATSNAEGYYINSDGTIVSNTTIGNKFILYGKPYSGEYNGKYYSDGELKKNAWAGDYYLGSDGLPVKNTWVDGYYLGSDGKYVRGTSLTIGKDYYTFDATGKATKDTKPKDDTKEQETTESNKQGGIDDGGSGNTSKGIELTVETSEEQLENTKIIYKIIRGATSKDGSRDDEANAIEDASTGIDNCIWGYFEELAEHSSAPKEIMVRRLEVTGTSNNKVTITCTFDVTTKTGRSLKNKKLKVTVDLDGLVCDIPNKPSLDLS